MANIISNTGPLIALSGVSQLDLLKCLFKNIAVPEPVHHEILAGGRYFIGVAEYRKAKWIEVIEIDTDIDPLLSTILDMGEASVIHTARNTNTQKILMDERKGRKIARDVYGLEVMGTARVLVEARKAGLIPNVKQLFLEMRQAGYWIHDKIINAALHEVSEA